MISVVVDASVGIKWLELFVKEPLVDQARRLLERRNRQEMELLVPDLFWPEVGGILWKAVRKRECAPDDASEGLSLLEDQEVQTIPSYSLIAPALEIAIQHDRSVYDCIYIALAKVSRSEFITADERLANAVAAYLPVKWLGAI